MRIIVDLEKWDKLILNKQQSNYWQRQVTGCPVTRIDRNKKSEDPRCPVRGTFEVTESGNEELRNISISKSSYSSQNIYDTLLEQSHVARANPSKLGNNGIPEMFQIFRQGFEFLEPLDYFNGIRLGLNFISFRTDPERIMKLIKYGFNKPQKQYSEDPRLLEDFLSVRACGVFLYLP